MCNQFSVKDKVMVVTGATDVLGHAFINALAEEGATVGALGRNEKAAGKRVEKIIQLRGKAVSLIADVTNEAQLIAAREKMLDGFGAGTWLGND